MLYIPLSLRMDAQPATGAFGSAISASYASWSARRRASKSTVSTFANDRLQVIQQRVMTSQHLSDIIDQFAERLCGGSDEMYRYKGKCRPMERFDAGTVLTGDDGRSSRNLHGRRD